MALITPEQFWTEPAGETLDFAKQKTEGEREMLTCQHLKSIPTIALMFFCIPDGSFRHGEPLDFAKQKTEGEREMLTCQHLKSIPTIALIF